ncbi:MAG: molybdopterin molybdenumtransferase MoeA, partial [Gammaproteobacteria bacterium]|nr:molybdopterin molybdenumtransferase MoeA [Gammaproteobacteria bacterium]
MTKKISTTVPAEHFRISVAKAAKLILEHMAPATSEFVNIADANQRILQEPVYAERDQPPFNRATMDGIAIASDSIGKGEFPVAGIQAAGKKALTLTKSNCIEVMTGAVMPTGADTVIPIERITIEANHASIEAGYSIRPAQFVHPQGSDHKKDDVLLQPGIKIGPAEMAVLAAAGKPEVRVSKTPTIAIVSTGDELVDVGEP